MDSGKQSLSPISRASVQQEVLLALRTALSSGVFAPGERLLEQSISDRLGVSRAPVREALRQLMGEGLVVAQAHKGTSVVELTNDDLIEIHRLRAALEPVAMERLIELRDPEHVVVLRAIVEEIKLALPAGDPVVLATLDMKFHETMCELSGMPRLLNAWRALGNQLRMYFAVGSYFFDDESFVVNHEKLITVIEEGDLDRAYDELQGHLLGSEGWRQYRAEGPTV